MTTNQIKYFLSIASGKTFTETARQFFISQPAVSNQIAQLEKEVGVALFDRQKNGVTTLTPSGTRFQEFFTRILSELETLKKNCRQLEDEAKNSLTIAFLPNLAWNRVSDAMNRFIAQYPYVNINLRVLEGEHLFQALADGQADVCISFSGPQEEDDLTGYAREYLTLAPLCIIYSRSFPELSPRELASQTLFLPRDPAAADRLLDGCRSFLQENGLAEMHTAPTDSIEEALSRVSAGLGCTIIASTASHLFNDRFHLMPTGGNHLISALYLPSNPKPYIQEFIHMLKESI